MAPKYPRQKKENSARNGITLDDSAATEETSDTPFVEIADHLPRDLEIQQEQDQAGLQDLNTHEDDQYHPSDDNSGSDDYTSDGEYGTKSRIAAKVRTKNSGNSKAKAASKKIHKPEKDEEKPTVPNNGRFVGRQLISWGPAVDQQFLLYHIWDMEENGTKLDWWGPVKALFPKATHSSVRQHYKKLRTLMLKEGYLVPPCPSEGHPGGSGIRGYIRVPGTDEHDLVVRPVLDGEEVVQEINHQGRKVGPEETDGSWTHKKHRKSTAISKAKKPVTKSRTKKFDVRKGSTSVSGNEGAFETEEYGKIRSTVSKRRRSTEGNLERPSKRFNHFQLPKSSKVSIPARGMFSEREPDGKAIISFKLDPEKLQQILEMPPCPWIKSIESAADFEQGSSDGIYGTVQKSEVVSTGSSTGYREYSSSSSYSGMSSFDAGAPQYSDAILNAYDRSSIPVAHPALDIPSFATGPETPDAEKPISLGLPTLADKGMEAAVPVSVEVRRAMTNSEYENQRNFTDYPRTNSGAMAVWDIEDDFNTPTTEGGLDVRDDTQEGYLDTVTEPWHFGQDETENDAMFNNGIPRADTLYHTAYDSFDGPSAGPFGVQHHNTPAFGTPSQSPSRAMQQLSSSINFNSVSMPSNDWHGSFDVSGPSFDTDSTNSTPTQADAQRHFDGHGSMLGNNSNNHSPSIDRHLSQNVLHAQAPQGLGPRGQENATIQVSMDEWANEWENSEHGAGQ